MEIRFNGGSYASPVDNNSSGALDANELNKVSNAEILMGDATLADLINLTGAASSTASWDIERLMKEAGKSTGSVPTDPAKLEAEVKKLTDQLGKIGKARGELQSNIDRVEGQLKTLRAKLAAAGPNTQAGRKFQNQINELDKTKVAMEKALAQTDAVLTALANRAKEAVKLAEDKASKGSALETAKTELEAQIQTAEQILPEPAKPASAGGKAAKPLAPGNKPGAQPKAATAGGAGGTGTGTGTGPFGQPRAAGAFDGFPSVDPTQIMMSQYMQDQQLSGLDAAGKQQAQAQRMMMMFFYLAQQAMSGDMDAMYQFMRFIGTIVNQDKAMQNVQLGKKMIELQTKSRELTQKLVEQPSYDENNREVETEYMKLQQTTQADQGVLATSQKLIGQMLEEFGQVSEMMTGMVKSLLDARGRELQMVSVWRA